MRLRKQVNIDNTFRVLNLNFYDTNNAIVLKKENMAKIKQALKNQDEATYVVDHFNSYVRQQKAIYDSGQRVILHTKTVIPVHVFLAVGTNRKSYYVYELHDFTQKELQNMQTASAVSTVAIEINHINSKTNLRELLFQLNDTRYIADQVLLNFDDETDVALINAVFDYFHEILARWKLQLFIRMNDKEQKNQLRSDIIARYK